MLERFVSNSPNKTPPMMVDVIDHNGKLSYSYKAPAGFQLERYVNHLFPNAELMVTCSYFEINVSVIIPGNKEIYQIHRGVYEKSLTR